MKKLNTIEPGKIEEVAIIAFFIIFFLFTVVAESTAQVNGNSGHCRQFNGTSSGVSFTKNDPGLASVSAMTITAWVKCNSTSGSGSWAGIANINDSSSNGDNGQFWLQHSSSNTQFEFAVENNSGNRVFVQSVTNPTDGNWYHVAGVYDGSNIYIYVNGVMEAKTAQTGKINNFSSTFKMVFGRWAYSGNSYRRFDGEIDEVTLWNVALTQTQIRTYMCKKLLGTESGLIGYWRMNETAGNLLGDVTSNARTGTATGTKIVWSGAPIGDASNYIYGGTSISISNPTYKDSLVASNFSSTPSGVQIYRIDTIPNCTTPPTGFLSVPSTYYYGVFVCDNSGANFKITYYYNGNPVVTNPSQTSIATRLDDSVLSWVDLTPTLNTGKGYFQKGGQKNRAEYAIALKTNPLPIHLLTFAASQSDNTVNITWTTATEVNNDYFSVERSTDGISYEVIATVKGAGNSETELDYKITDNSPVAGVAYYRLSQTDFDGTTKSFAPVAVNFTPQITSTFAVEKLYPTAFTSSFSVQFMCDNTVDITVELYSMNGSLVKQDMMHCVKGSNQYEFTNNLNLQPGIYVLNLIDANSGHKVTEKVIKQ